MFGWLGYGVIMVEFQKSDEGKRAYIIFKKTEESQPRELLGIIDSVDVENRSIRFKLFTGQEHGLTWDSITYLNITGGGRRAKV